MKTVVGGLVLVSFVLGFSSCQKEIDWGLNTPTQGGNSTMLKKVILLDTSLPTGLDTISKAIIEYDNQNRVVQVNASYKDQNLPPTSSFPFYDSLVYFYNGNDTQPFKVIKSKASFLTIEKDTGFLFYAAGKVIRDSIRSSYLSILPPPTPPVEQIKVNIFTDNGNTTNVLTYLSMTLNPPSWPPACPGTTIFQKTYVNGNITYQFGDYTSCSSIGTSETNHFIFDTHPNPGYTFSVPYPIIDEDLNLSDQKNNILETWDTAPGDGFRNTYTYRADGYPLIVRGVDLTDPTITWKGFYIYK
jgi:hypothetical protein